MADIFFCKSWFRAKKRLTVLWDEAQAREAHERRKPYTALIGDVERPTHVVELNDRFVGVEFLDDLLRAALSFQYREVEPGKLFLSMATYREFDDDSDRVLVGTSYMFERDGALKIRREKFDPHGIEEANGKADVAANFEPYPAFGRYDGICVAERVAPSDDGDSLTA